MNWIEQKRVLNDLGYKNYSDYLSGIVWANIKEKVLKLHNNRCTICSRNATTIHHREYTEEVFRGTDITPLEPLCWDCHIRVEFDQYGQKNNLSYANNKIDWFKRNKSIWMKKKWSSISVGIQKEHKYFKSPLLN